MRTWPGFVALSITLVLMVATLFFFRAEAHRGLVVVALLAGVGALAAIVLQGMPGDSVTRHARSTPGDDRANSAALADLARKLTTTDTAHRPEVVAAIGELADRWPAGRRRCIDALCNHLRTTPGDAAPIVRLVAAHLRKVGPTTWQGYDLDFSGAVLDTVSFARAVFAGADISFKGASFTGQIAFDGARFCDATVDFSGATFSGAAVDFSYATFAEASIDLRRARIEDSQVDFFAAAISRTTIDLTRATARAESTVRFARALLAKVELRVGPEVREWVDLTDVRAVDVRMEGMRLPEITGQPTGWSGRDRRAM
ncbi:hypothetical protein F4553_005126 [Allocatelliglobosispora scoriae]|uniref:Pentapeptide repeat-containing protein n=1 Tax=Allocatelliglobosispora scoriae TaxID=643052 RepID=A0A841BRS1_9ACTN|nr:pentapeptide repeat-containing protein [Allocatelliglobosispora scoriae]MBB5871747.1 hypothetical protein [Allocatelliglobosispora scoriae]